LRRRFFRDITNLKSFNIMLGRRHFRIKVFQALYAWFQGGEARQDVAERALCTSIDKIYELYYLQLSFFVDLMDFYRRKLEDARHKFLPTEEDINPNTKLLTNVVLGILLENKDLGKQVRKYSINWSDEQEMLRKAYLKVRNSKDLKDYLSSGTNLFEDDREIIYKLFKKVVAKSGDLQFYCEERNIFWLDDYQSAALLVMKTIRLITEGFGPDQVLPALLEKEEDPEDDDKFVKELFRKTISQSETFDRMIDAKTKNWELERIALTDIVLIKMALVELLYFSSVPIKVTLNEYIEMSKLFSTPKSQIFVNGLLDKIVEGLKEDKKIKKTGRGLI
jgi:transcription antitermination protein NusB